MESAKCAFCLVARGGEVVEHRANPWYKGMTIDKEKDLKHQVMQWFVNTLDKADLAGIENATTTALKAPSNCKAASPGESSTNIYIFYVIRKTKISDTQQLKCWWGR